MTELGVPISEKYEKKIKKHFDIKSFAHLVPDNPHSKKLRELKLKDFGFREIKTLNKKSKKAVEAFKDKFDIKRFSRPKMLRYFRQVTVNEVDKVAIIRNIISSHRLFR